MAEETPKEAAPAEGAEKPAKGKKKGLILGGGIVGVLGLAFAASLMAVPKKEKVMRFDGPYVGALSDGNIAVNLADNEHKRYLQMNLSVEYEAYGSDYFNKRLTDPLYKPHLMDALQRVTNSRYSKDVMGPIQQPIFLEEIGRAIEPVIFPVHVGPTLTPFAKDEKSGLRPGFSMPDATFRGRFYDHKLIVDSAAKTMRIDEGPTVAYQGDETDLEIADTAGRTIYLNVTELDPEFSGELQVGVHGQVRRMLVGQFILQ